MNLAQEENDLLSGGGAEAVFRGGFGAGNQPRPEAGFLEKLPEGGLLLRFPGLHVTLGKAPCSGTPLEQEQNFRVPAKPPEGDNPAGFLKYGIDGGDKILLLKTDGLGDLPLMERKPLRRDHQLVLAVVVPPDDGDDPAGKA